MGQRSEGRNVTAICGMEQEGKKASGKMAAGRGEGFLNEEEGV